MAGQFILASGSPRRRDLLADAGFDFEVIAPDVEEAHTADLTLRELTCLNAGRKAFAAAALRRDAIVVAADTLVRLDRDVLGKPQNLDQARAFLRRLSGRTHEVCSCVVLAHAQKKRERRFHEVTRVRFRELDDAAIDDYFARVNPLDKAGAYAAQGEGARIINRIEGSFTNVVGLPLEQTIAALREFGIEPRER